jgi:hypothetical protein
MNMCGCFRREKEWKKRRERKKKNREEEEGLVHGYV